MSLSWRVAIARNCFRRAKHRFMTLRSRYASRSSLGRTPAHDPDGDDSPADGAFGDHTTTRTPAARRRARIAREQHARSAITRRTPARPRRAPRELHAPGSAPHAPHRPVRLRPHPPFARPGRADRLRPGAQLSTDSTPAGNCGPGGVPRGGGAAGVGFRTADVRLPWVDRTEDRRTVAEVQGRPSLPGVDPACGAVPVGTLFAASVSPPRRQRSLGRTWNAAGPRRTWRAGYSSRAGPARHFCGGTAWSARHAAGGVAGGHRWFRWRRA
ncbi:hypothetical protein EHYA_09977 [Embleya hyalina]|uniref:Uncharacterized protein n=1 Tax=Embleya hyalina TaxID=516124 RepID=A0A401Z5R0_9ACTN|nr:hypothetical protein EHYA_09977 [Embleya hyalina]